MNGELTYLGIEPLRIALCSGLLRPSFAFKKNTGVLQKFLLPQIYLRWMGTIFLRNLIDRLNSFNLNSSVGQAQVYVFSPLWQGATTTQPALLLGGGVSIETRNSPKGRKNVQLGL